MAEKKKLTLEAAMVRLEEIVKEMENEKLPLDKSLKLYEEGIGLVSMCSAELETAKRKIQILQMGKDGEIELVDMQQSVNSDEE
ncbi:MAG: exodeoxyribonuclease VII small subunit [Ruminococcaceae bacterium]|nr:exodeoxyribonuclease VII small subunit [Oscillospiraceae bacterium]